MDSTDQLRGSWTTPTIANFVDTNLFNSVIDRGNSLERTNSTNLVRGAWMKPTIGNVVDTSCICPIIDRRNSIERMSSTILVRGAWTEPTIQNNAATIEVFPVYIRWNILQRMNGTNLAGVAWNEHTIQNFAAATNNVSPIFDRWSSLQRMRAANVARVKWNAGTIQNTAATSPTSLPLILPDSLSQFLDLTQRRHSYSMDQIMSYELLRLHSFKCNFPVSAIRLAQSGYFATGVVDEVKCFSCGVYYRNWQPTDIPHLLHERLSPHCRLVDNAMSYQTIK